MHRRCLITAARQLHQVHWQFIQPQHYLARIRRFETAALEIRRIQFHCHGETGRNHVTHGLDHLQQQPRAIFQAATPAILALVAQRRKKLAQQVTVGSVDLYPTETRFFSQRRSAGEALDQRADLGFVQSLGQGEQLGQTAHVQGNGRRRHGGLAEVGLHLPARVVDLHPELRAVGAADARPVAKTLQWLAGIEHHASWPGHGAGVDHHVTGQQQPGTALGPSLVKAQQLVGRGLVRVGQVFLHRRLGDAVVDDTAIGQVQGLERRHGDLRKGCHASVFARVG
ncbi:hypothetical protein D3C75_839030 [compost metagenome]